MSTDHGLAQLTGRKPGTILSQRSLPVRPDCIVAGQNRRGSPEGTDPGRPADRLKSCRYSDECGIVVILTMEREQRPMLPSVPGLKKTTYGTKKSNLMKDIEDFNCVKNKKKGRRSRCEGQAEEQCPSQQSITSALSHVGSTTQWQIRHQRITGKYLRVACRSQGRGWNHWPSSDVAFALFRSVMGRAKLKSREEPYLLLSLIIQTSG